MTEITGVDSILSRQLKIIEKSGIKNIVMTTGYFDDVLVDYCKSLNLSLEFEFIKNPIYDCTNYIYSIFCAREYLQDDVIMMHGDLVFDETVFKKVVNSENSCMTVSSTIPLPEKDFKAVLNGNRIDKVGIEFFENAVSAQPLYKINKKDWLKWLKEIETFCENDNIKCYAENAFNMISDNCEIYALDIKDELCCEIDTPEDWVIVKEKLYKSAEKAEEINNELSRKVF